ncbi:MAG: AsmA family protein [Deltaproteobacteria bacterium]|nr:AsmA family protein [Deltaproteobacteria bacterium]
MKRLIKWCLIVCFSIIVLIIASLLIVPHFINIQRYKPLIEKKVAEATGRSFAIGEDLNLSLFPVAGISFSDLHLGNPQGFEKKDFVVIESFEARVDMIKLILSLFKDVRITRFIIKNPEIILIQKKSLSNWEGIGKKSKDAPASPEPKSSGKKLESELSIPINSFNVDKFSISGGSIIFIDEIKGIKREISNLSLQIDDLSLDHPILINFSAKLDGHPVSLKGIIGPSDKKMFKGKIPFDLSVMAANQLDIKIDGFVIDPAATAEAEIKLRVAPFSPRKLCKQLGFDFPVKTSDPDVLTLLAFKLNLKRETNNISVSSGFLEIDDSKLKFSADAKEFSKPDLNFNMELDQIDLDKYLPPEQKKIAKKQEVGLKGEGPAKKQIKADSAPASKPDYTPLRKLLLKGRVRIGKMKICNAKIKDIDLLISGKDGIFKINPLTLNLYQGDVTMVGIVDVKNDILKSSLALDIKNFNAGGLIADILEKDVLEGTLNTTLNLKVRGLEPSEIKKSLNGSGQLNLTDGAIKGIDLTAMVKNTKSAFTKIIDGKEESITKFGIFSSSFTITNGIVNTSNTEFISHDIRLTANGNADLVKELLNFRLEPFLVKKKGDKKKDRKGSEYLIPVLVTGNFTSPKFRPDIKKVINKELKKQVFESSEFKKLFKNEELKPLEETTKKLLKGLFQ